MYFYHFWFSFFTAYHRKLKLQQFPGSDGERSPGWNLDRTTYFPSPNPPRCGPWKRPFIKRTYQLNVSFVGRSIMDTINSVITICSWSFMSEESLRNVTTHPCSSCPPSFLTIFAWNKLQGFLRIGEFSISWVCQFILAIISLLSLIPLMSPQIKSMTKEKHS